SRLGLEFVTSVVKGRLQKVFGGGVTRIFFVHRGGRNSGNSGGAIFSPNRSGQVILIFGHCLSLSDGVEIDEETAAFHLEFIAWNGDFKGFSQMADTGLAIELK